MIFIEINACFASIKKEKSERRVWKRQQRGETRSRESICFAYRRTSVEVFDGRLRATYCECNDNALAMDITPFYDRMKGIFEIKSSRFTTAKDYIVIFMRSLRLTVFRMEFRSLGNERGRGWIKRGRFRGVWTLKGLSTRYIKIFNLILFFFRERILQLVSNFC